MSAILNCAYYGKCLTVTIWNLSDLKSTWSNYIKKKKNIIYVTKQGSVTKHIVLAWTLMQYLLPQFFSHTEKNRLNYFY